MPEPQVATMEHIPADKRWRIGPPKYLKRVKDPTPKNMDFAARSMLKRARLCATEGVPFHFTFVCYGDSEEQTKDATDWMGGVFHRFGFEPKRLLGDKIEVVCEDIARLREIVKGFPKGQYRLMFVDKYAVPQK